MGDTQSMLEEAVKAYGVNDIVTIMLSQRRDKEINCVQTTMREQYKVGVECGCRGNNR